MKQAIIYFLGFLFYSSVYSQNDCKELLAKYVEDMGRISTPEVGKVYFLHMLIQNKYRNETHAVNNIEIKACLTDSHMQMNSSLMQIYADTSDSFTIIPATRQIVRREGINFSGDTLQRQSLQMVQLDLIKNSTISRFKDYENSREITLAPDLETSKRLNISNIVLEYHFLRKQVSKVRILYTKDSSVSEQIIDYKELDFDSSFKLDKSTVESMILTDSGSLKKEFSDYTLIDVKGNG